MGGLFGLVESGVFEFGLHFRVTRRPHTPNRLITVPPLAGSSSTPR